jgi:hypothetical protein
MLINPAVRSNGMMDVILHALFNDYYRYSNIRFRLWTLTP